MAAILTGIYLAISLIWAGHFFYWGYKRGKVPPLLDINGCLVVLICCVLFGLSWPYYLFLGVRTYVASRA